MHLYTGGYTKEPNGRAPGIGIFSFEPDTGVITAIGWQEDVVNPSFLAASADGRNLYAVAEGDGEGAVVAYARDAVTGGLTELNRQGTVGRGPCHVSLDRTGRYVLVANYGSGSVAALPVQPDGSLGDATGSFQQEGTSVNADRQEGPHAHMILASPDNAFVFATDLGADRIFGYRLNQESGTLTLAPEAGGVAEPGAGPRHFAFSPDGGTVYVINELDSTLAVYDYDAESGAFTSRQVLPTLPPNWQGDTTTAQVVVSPDGRYVYGSNRGHDSIAVFSVNAETGEVTAEEIVTAGGKTPRNFNLSPDEAGRWLVVANMGSDNVVVWPRNPESGYPEGDGATYDIPSACCLVFIGE